jgi:hypothetical protein
MSLGFSVVRGSDSLNFGGSPNTFSRSYIFNGGFSDSDIMRRDIANLDCKK